MYTDRIFFTEVEDGYLFLLLIIFSVKNADIKPIIITIQYYTFFELILTFIFLNN